MSSGFRNSSASISPGLTGFSFLLIFHPLRSMIVDDLDVLSAIAPAKADAELIVHADAPLPCPISLQSFQAVAWRSTHVFNSPGQVELLELTKRRALDVHKPSHAPQIEQALRVSAPERLDRHVL